jgi:hypothetical protein
MFEKWMVTWVPFSPESDNRGRRYDARFFTLGSEAYACWEQATGSEVAIYRKVKKGGNQLKPRHYVWELVEFVDSAR